MNRIFHLTTCNLVVKSRILCRQQYSTSPTSLGIKTEQNNEWRVIYKLPLVRLASAFNRLKIYQAMLTALSIPISHVLVGLGEVPQQVPHVVSTLGVTGIITLSLGSLVLRNLVGLIYINNNEDSVKIAYVDFWGSRRHVVTNIDELVPNWKIAKTRFAFYQGIQMHSQPNKTFKLIQRYGVVLDSHTFTGLFGE